MEELYMSDSENITEKEGGFKISREDLKKAIDEFLKNGGKIQTFKTVDTYYSSNPVKSDNFSKNRGPINGDLIKLCL